MTSSITMISQQIVSVSPSLAAPLEPLTQCRNIAHLSLFYSYYFGSCSSELDELVPLPPSRGRSARYSNRLHDFSVSIPGCYKDVYLNSCFLARLDSGILCLQNAFRWPMIWMAWSLEFCSALWFSYCSCNSMPRSNCSFLHGVKPSYKKWLVIKRSKLWKC